MIKYDEDILNSFSGNPKINYDSDLDNMFSTATEADGMDALKLRKISAYSMGIGALAEIGGSISSYFQGQTSADFMRLQAAQIELEAKQTGNRLREELYGNISKSFAGYAARGVDIGSGTPMTMAQMSMKEGGEDIQQINKNAKLKADVYRAQADITKKSATTDMLAGMAGAFGKLAIAKGSL